MNDGEPGDRGRGVAPKTKEAMAARPMGTGDAPFIGADMDDDEGIIHQERRVSSAQSQISNQRGGGLHPSLSLAPVAVGGRAAWCTSAGVTRSVRLLVDLLHRMSLYLRLLHRLLALSRLVICPNRLTFKVPAKLLLPQWTWRPRPSCCRCCGGGWCAGAGPWRRTWPCQRTYRTCSPT